ncbi:MAG TPA: hypothetical protein VKU41_13335 [Polyangiaceae bacterium]|nr:hypothetical protein [Polyangiaceae bacterium]
MKLTSKVAVSLGLPLAIAGCGGSPASAGDGEKTDHIAQAFGESTCGGALPDVGGSSTYIINGYFQSSDGNYDHWPTCSHVFVAEGIMVNTYPTNYAYATYAGPIAQPSNYGCGAMWAAVSLWEDEGSAGWVKIADSPPAYGYQYGNECIAPTAMITIPDYARYKVIGQAGLIYSYVPVQIGAVNNSVR